MGRKVFRMEVIPMKNPSVREGFLSTSCEVYSAES